MGLRRLSAFTFPVSVQSSDKRPFINRRRRSIVSLDPATVRSPSSGQILRTISAPKRLALLPIERPSSRGWPASAKLESCTFPSLSFWNIHLPPHSCRVTRRLCTASTHARDWRRRTFASDYSEGAGLMRGSLGLSPEAPVSATFISEPGNTNFAAQQGSSCRLHASAPPSPQPLLRLISVVERLVSSFREPESERWN